MQNVKKTLRRALELCALYWQIQRQTQSIAGSGHQSWEWHQDSWFSPIPHQGYHLFDGFTKYIAVHFPLCDYQVKRHGPLLRRCMGNCLTARATCQKLTEAVTIQPPGCVSTSIETCTANYVRKVIQTGIWYLDYWKSFLQDDALYLDKMAFDNTKDILQVASLRYLLNERVEKIKSHTNKSSKNLDLKVIENVNQSDFIHNTLKKR